ncbi:MAG: ribosome maturation factor RimP [Pantoea sp. Brub]|nr:ribosome maturation factor RimP [Pantoea sp. Brub]
MSTLKQKIINLILLPIESLGYNLIGVEFMHYDILKIRIYIDNINGISIDDCTKVSYKISKLIDIEDFINVPYNLEISSPGLNRPLFTINHYLNFLGQKIKIQLHSKFQKKYKFIGTLKSVKGDIITINIEGNDKVFALNDIKKANLIHYF